MTALSRPRAQPSLDLAQAAALFAVPARAQILVALEDREECAAGQLAELAGVSASTASSHLSYLVAQGLLVVERRGRSRLYRLAGPQVKAALESLRRLAELAGR